MGPLRSSGPVREDASTTEVSGSRKRNRPGLSCHGCRRRKYRCDGQRPACMPCERSKIPCVYDADGPIPDQETPPKPPSQPRLPVERGFHKRPKALSTAAAAEILWSYTHEDPAAPRPGTMAHSSLLGVDVHELCNARDFRGSGFHTHYYGFTHVANNFSDFTQLLTYGKHFMDRHSSLFRAHVEMRQRDKAARARFKSHAPTRNACPLYEFLPPQDKTNRLVELYLDTFEQCFHVLHLPSFNRQLNKLWENDLVEAPESHVATVLLMIAMVNCVDDSATEVFSGSQSVCREAAVSWIDRVGVWLHNHSHKHIGLAYFQVRCLFLMARFVIGIKVKQWWNDSGSLHRFAIAAGLHLDTTTARLGSKVSPFEREMRRRLWVVIEELELHATLHRGVSPSRAVQEADCGTPTNVADDQLSEDVPSIPPAVKQSIYTPATPLITMAQSQALRCDLLAFFANPASSALTQMEVLEWEERLLSALRAIPAWQHSPITPASGARGTSALPRAVQRSALLELLLLLHTRALASPATAAFRHHSRHARLQAAATLLDNYNGLSPAARLLLICYRGDGFQAAMSICSTLCEAPDPAADSTLTPLGVPSPADLCALIERALELFELRVNHLVGMLKRYWLLGCAHGLARRVTDPVAAERHEAAAANRIGATIYKQLSLQAESVGQTGACAGVASAGAVVKASAGAADQQTRDLPPVDYTMSFDDLPMFEGVDMADLDLEDFLGLE